MFGHEDYKESIEAMILCNCYIRVFVASDVD